MQPHSISALAVARYVFAFDRPLPKGGEVQIKYKKWDGSDWLERKLYHDIKKVTPIVHTGDIFWRGLAVEVKANDSLTCEVIIKRKSGDYFKKGNQSIEVFHRVQHLAGLWEEYTKIDRTLIEGKHHGSRKYRNFNAKGEHSTFFKLSSDVKKVSEVNGRNREEFVVIDYVVNFRPTH